MAVASSSSGPDSAMRPSSGAEEAAGAVADQPPIAGAAASCAGADATGLRAATAVGTHRPPSADSPAGQGCAQTLSGWPWIRLSNTTSGSSIGKLALTRSVKVFMARLVEVVQPPLISPS